MSRGLYGSGGADNLRRTGVAEFVGTFFLVFSGTAVAVSAALGLPIAGEASSSLAVGLAFGLALVALVYTFGHVSGAHFNPAVTLGLAATGRFPWKAVPVYIGAQLLGAIVASLAVWALFGDAAREVAGLAATQPAPDVGSLEVFALEAIVTFFLVLVILSVATDERVDSAVAGIAVGFTLAVCVLVAGPLSGGAVNPARALGPMLVAGRLAAAWAYVLGPILGGLCAAFLYDRFLAQAEAPTDDD